MIVQRCTTLAEAEAEAKRDRAERADPNTSRLVNARDHHAASGRFELADSAQLLVETIRAQGRTTDVAHRRVDSMGRSRSYPPVTRGRER